MGIAGVIAGENDALRMNYQIKQDEKVNGCKALALCVRGWHELIDAGLTTGNLVCISWDDSVLWAEDEASKVVAVMTYKASDWNRTLWISLSFVHPEHRRRGLYSRLYSRALEIAREKLLTKVESGISPQNEAMLAAAKASGRTLSYVVYGRSL
jgi:GNAT superfamily N-acetyltransferase